MKLRFAPSAIEDLDEIAAYLRERKAFGPPPVKQAVFPLVERESEIRSFYVANVTAKTLRPIIVKYASRQSAFMTDEAEISKTSAIDRCG